jgi:hypothetical protein
MGFRNAALLGRIAEIAIVAFAVVMAVNQIGIAANLVNTLFIGVVGAFALAFGLAFGLGGRDVAAQLTQRWYEQSQAAAARVRGEVEPHLDRLPGQRPRRPREVFGARGESIGNRRPVVPMTDRSDPRSWRVSDLHRGARDLNAREHCRAASAGLRSMSV